ncbi:solute carrier family 2, facilitated glucose transporter member 1-like [Trichoplusia ni]|uniref:Solute carrier family 2, facilitated glucose transporter member 1-like n=1 Tax=Trichoplusia ni TaxID=7111 RepID=A0A7E5X469_TRINI|nr:solute carrier family 2, facilitated glucose transporter member 1-like [Trichoplusia ni]
MGAMNIRLAFAIIASSCWSAFQHGYNTGVLNAPHEIICEWLQRDALTGTNTTVPAEDDKRVNTAMSVIVSIYCVGGMIGGVFTGLVADRFGRKGGLLLNNIFVFLGAACEGAAKSANSAELIMLGRLLIGVNSGFNAGLAPLYVSEIAPVSIRGSIGTVYQLVISVTILLSQALGLESALGNDNDWPYLLALTAIPAVLQCLTLPFCPESPKYLLLKRGKDEKAQKALTWFQRTDAAILEEMEEMHQEAEKTKVSKVVTLRQLILKQQLRQPLIIAVMVMAAQQLSGINAVIFYSTAIFHKIQLSRAQSQYATLAIGITNVVMTGVSLFLVETTGRKTLLTAGFFGMMLSTVSLSIAINYSHVSWVSYLCIAIIILFVAMFAIGPGSIPWFLVTELFNQAARPSATSVAVTVNWTANFVVGLSFLPLSLVIGSKVFIIFAAVQIILILFIHFKVPETKNKTVEEITAMFRQNM